MPPFLEISRTVMRPLLIAGCVAVAHAPLHAVETAQVVDVVVEGTKRIHPDRVINRLQTRVGQAWNEAALNDDVRTIEEMGAFANTTKSVELVGPGQVRVIFRVRELPYVGEVVLDGIGYFARQSVEKVLTVRKGSYLNPMLVEADRRAIQANLRTKQYLNATVTALKEVDETSGIGTVTYRIDLGERVIVARTLYEGLPPGAFKYFIDQELINSPGRVFQPDMLELNDVDTVARHLQDLGYLDAQITQHRVEFFDEVPAFEERARNGPKLVPEGRFNNRAVITYWVDAGPRYRLRNVRFLGNTVVTEEALREAFALPRGNWFNRNELERAKREALGLVRNRGYAQSILVEDPVADLETHEIDLTLELVEGDRYVVGRVDIDGDIKTKDAVVRRSMRLLPGDLWSDEKRDRSLRQLGREGVFTNNRAIPNRISPLYETKRPHPADPDLQLVDLLAEVSEERTGSFGFNLGYTTAVGLVGQVTFTERNFDLWGLLTGEGWRGAAHRLNASAQWSEDSTELRLSWSNLHLMDSDYQLATIFVRKDSSALDWDERRLTSTVRLGRNFLDNDLSLRAEYSYIDLKIDDIDADANNDALAANEKYFINQLGLSQEYNQLDNSFIPTRGWRIKLDQTLNGAFADHVSSDEYYRLDAEFDGFVPLFDSDLGGTTYVHFSQKLRRLEAIGDSDEVPFYDRLYGGGPTPRFRGFESYDLGPFQINDNGFSARKGGNREWLSTLELSVPLQGTQTGIRGIVFADAGQVWDEEENFSLNDLRYSAGVGVRFPAQFPVAFDYAWLLDAESGEDRTQFHFSISAPNF